MAKKGKKKGKKMSPALKAFLKREGRFPQKGELRRAKKAARASKKQARRSRSMAKKKGGGGSRKQGFVSWITSLIALFIGLGPALSELIFGLFNGDWAARADNLNRFYNPLRGDKAALTVGYGSLVGGLVFKIATSELTKRAKVTSILPAMHA